MVPAFASSSKVLREKDINDSVKKLLAILMLLGWTLFEQALLQASIVKLCSTSRKTLLIIARITSVFNEYNNKNFDDINNHVLITKHLMGNYIFEKKIITIMQ